MDSIDSGIIAIVGLVISVGSSVLAIVNHRRLRSNCCGLPLIVSVDVETTTPPTDLRIKIPGAKECEQQKQAGHPVGEE
jgi:hypothetical protein